MESILKQCLQLIKEYEVLSPVTTTFWNLACPYIYMSIIILFLIFLGIFANTVLLIIICKKSIELNKQTEYICKNTKQENPQSVGDFG